MLFDYSHPALTLLNDEPQGSSLNAPMIQRLSRPLQAVVVACALAVGITLIVSACAEDEITHAHELRENRVAAAGETRVVLVRPVMKDGRTGEYAPKVLYLRPVPANEPWPAELGERH